MKKSILFCFAHPDDEVGLAPLVARYMQEEGAEVTLVCTTNGDVGTVDEQYLQGYASIPELRLAELACAAKTIGFSEVITFGYRDSGMMGTADNQHPDSFWQAPLEEVTLRLMEIMRRVRPQIVMTFNTFGAYGHPDHIKINQATVEAFQRLQSETEHPQKLYYTAISRRMIGLGIKMMRLLGKDPRKGGRNADVDYVATYEALTPVTTSISVKPYLSVAWKAMDCYASQIQIPALLRSLRGIIGPFFLNKIELARVYPEPLEQEATEHDIFEKVAF